MVAVKRNCKDIEECLHPAGHQLKPATFPTLAPNVLNRPGIAGGILV